MNIEVGRRYLVGSNAKCDICIVQPDVAPFHAELFKLNPRTYLVRDLGSEAGTVVRRDSVYLARIHRDEEIRFGTAITTMREIEGGRGLHTRSTDTAETVTLDPQSEYLLGASPDCDIRVVSSAVGWIHGTLTHDGQSWKLTPSGGGAPVRMGTGQPIHLGSRLFELNDQHQLSQSQFDNNRLDVERLSFVDDKGHPRLQEVSFSALSGQVIGIMGPSGAGKSVLLRCICGINRATSGNVYLYQTNLKTSPELLRGTLAYVPQDDLVSTELTVLENVRFAASLKLPRDWPPDAIAAWAEDVVTRLGLWDARDTPAAKISGGQRKRVQLAMELVTDPAFLIADEPCSGLSSWDAGNVVSLLRSMADAGRTVLFTIHSPEIEVLEKMDRLLIVDHGGLLAYFGPAYPTAMQYFAHRVVGPTESPKIIFDELERLVPGEARIRARTPQQWRDKFVASDLHTVFVEHPQRWLSEPMSAHPAVSVPAQRLSSLWLGSRLFARRARQQWLDRQDLLVSLGQGPIIALAFYVTFLGVSAATLGSGGESMWTKPLQVYGSWGGQQAIVFLAVLTAVWFGTSRGVVEIPSAWTVFHHERLTFLRPGTFVFPRFAVLAIVVFAQAFLFAIALGTLYLILPAFFRPEPFVGSDAPDLAVQKAVSATAAWAGVLSLTAVSALSVAMFVGSFFRSRRAAVAMLPFVLIVQALLAGHLPTLANMSAPVQWAAAMSTSLHGFEASITTLQRQLSPPEGSAVSVASFTEGLMKGAPSELRDELAQTELGSDASMAKLRREFGSQTQGETFDRFVDKVLDRAARGWSLGSTGQQLYDALVSRDTMVTRFRPQHVGSAIGRLVAVTLFFSAATLGSVSVQARRRQH